MATEENSNAGVPCSLQRGIFDVLSQTPCNPAVHYLPNRSLPQPTARASCGGDSSGPISGTSCRNGNDDKSGRCSQVDTADISDADNDDQPDAADVAADRRNLVGDALEPAEANEAVRGNGLNHTPAKAVMLPGANGAHFGLPRDAGATNGAQERARYQAATVGVTLPQGAGAEEYEPDLFDVLEAWVFEHLREKLHAGFLLSSHFQEYTRFLNVQHRPVTENDFILFRILGRGGFGAVNGAMLASPLLCFFLEIDRAVFAYLRLPTLARHVPLIASRNDLVCRV